MAQHILFHHSEGKPCLFNTITKGTLQDFLLTNEFFKKGSSLEKSWDDLFNFLVDITKYNHLPLEVFQMFSKDFVKIQPDKEDKKSYKIRKLIITISNEEQVYVKFKSEDTKVDYGRNRLTRKFGSDSFLIVQLETPFLSLSDKFKIQHQKSTACEKKEVIEEQEYLLAARQLNLFLVGEERIQNPPKSIRDGVTIDRLKRYNQSVSKINSILNNISINGRKFELLLTTTAGIHKQKYLFTSCNRRDILKWAFTSDSLLKMKSTPIKLSLRLALLNSNSISTELQPSFITEKDIVCEGHDQDSPMKPEWILTDGCGRISSSFAKKVSDYLKKIPKIQLKVPKKVKYENDGSYQHEWECPNILHSDKTPSAFQIRFGGSKGMLVVSPDTEMKGKDIIFTESMVKFESPDHVEHRTLEVMGISVPSPPVNLNNEIIDILSGCSGDKSNQLEKYLKEISSKYLEDHIFLLEDKERAKGYYEKNGETLAIQTLERYPEMENYPLIVAFLISFFRTTIIPLHFPIPFSCRLYGVADYSRSLEDKQVYICNGGVPIQGSVLLVKEPCFNKTDLQVFEAVECPIGLEHLDNVIVFSTKSKFSDPSKVAGSDLDGDKYVCLWDPNLLSICKNIFHLEPPQNENVPKKSVPQTPDTTASLDDVIVEIYSKMEKELVYTAVHSKEFCSLPDLLKLRTCTIDNLGSKWTENKEAQLIGQLLSKTVDAPKNNTWVRIQEIENLLSNAPKFPDYHLRGRKVSVRESISIRGNLFKYCLEAFPSTLPNIFPKNGLTIQDYKDYFQVLTGSLLLKDKKTSHQVMKLITNQEKKIYKRYCLLEMVAFYSLFSKILIKNDLDKIPKSIVLCSAPPKLYVSLTYLKEIMDPEGDSERYSRRLIHIIRNNGAFTPSYRVNRLILDKILEFYRNRPQENNNFPTFSNSNIDEAVGKLSPILGTYGFKSKDDPCYLKTPCYKQIFDCIKYLQRNTPVHGASSYSLKNDVEEKTGEYCFNSSMIIALYMLGYGDLFESQAMQGEKNAVPPPVPLYYHKN